MLTVRKNKLVIHTPFIGAEVSGGYHYMSTEHPFKPCLGPDAYIQPISVDQPDYIWQAQMRQSFGERFCVIDGLWYYTWDHELPRGFIYRIQRVAKMVDNDRPWKEIVSVVEPVHIYNKKFLRATLRVGSLEAERAQSLLGEMRSVRGVFITEDFKVLFKIN